jgi:hypothetical protein
MHVVGFTTSDEGVAILHDIKDSTPRTCFIVFNATDTFSVIQTYSYETDVVPLSVTTYQNGPTRLLFQQGQSQSGIHIVAKVSFNITHIFS